MRLRLLLLAILAAPGLLRAQTPAVPAAPAATGTVFRLLGTLESAPKEDGPWTALKLKSPVPAGIYLRTGKESRAEIGLPKDSLIRLGPESRLYLSKLLFPSENSDARVEARLLAGRLWAKVSKIFRAGDASPRFQVSAGTQVAGVRGTAFEIGYFPVTGDNLKPEGEKLPEPSGELKVYAGEVAVARYDPFKPAEAHQGGGIVPPTDVKGPGNVPPPFRDVTREEWTALVKAGMRVPFGSGDPAAVEPSKIDSKTDLKDDFSRWNRELDGLTELPK